MYMYICKTCKTCVNSVQCPFPQQINFQKESNATTVMCKKAVTILLQLFDRSLKAFVKTFLVFQSS